MNPETPKPENPPERPYSPDWQPMECAPKELGMPVWARGNNHGNIDNGTHFVWVYWNGFEWIGAEADPRVYTYLTHFLRARKEQP